MELPSDAPIVVVAPRLSEAPGEAAYSAAELGAAALSDAARVDRALRTIPGVSLFRRNDSAVANPTIQGMSVRAAAPSGAGRTLVLLDGAPLNDPFGGWVIWGALSPDALSRAIVLRGAGAGPYGAGALLGTVRLEERDDYGFALSAETGARGHWRASAFALAGDEHASLLLAAQAQHEDGFVPVRSGRGGADERVWLDASSASARVTARAGALSFSARAGLYDESRGAGLAGAQSHNTGNMFSLALARPEGARTWRLQAWALTSDLANSSVAVAPDRNAATPANDQIETPAFGWGGNAAMRWSDAAGGLEIGADLRMADGKTREAFRFLGGAFTRTRAAGGQTSLAGAYAEAWRESGPDLWSGGVRLDYWRASGGVRLERDTATGAAVLEFRPDDSEALAPTARAGVRRALDNNRSLRGAIYAGFRPPTLNELHRPFRVGNDVTEANAALEPERLMGADFALGGDGAAASWRLGAFASRLDDAIVNVTLGQGPGTFPPGVFVPAGGAYRQRQNAGAIDAIGLEAEASGSAGAFDWRAALNYTHARMRGGALDGLRPAQQPALSAIAALGWNIGAANRLAAELAYESARFEDDLNTRTLSPAATLDLRFERRLGAGVWLYAAWDNVFDAAVETAETGDGVESFGPPSALRFGLRLASD